MPLNLPDSAAELTARSKADVQRELATSNPFLKNSWLGAIVTAAANRNFDFYIQLQAAIREAFPDTATGEYLTRWAAIFGKSKLAATRATGNVVATGSTGSTIPIGTALAVQGVGTYTTIEAGLLTDVVANIDSITRSGTVATVTTTSDHSLANGVEVVVAGSAETEYNGTFEVTVTALNQFQYDVIGSPPDEPSSSATAAYTIASIAVQSDDFGQDVNLDGGTGLSLQSPIVGVDNTLTVDFGAVGGGTDQETDAALRLRLLDRIQNPVAHFNSADIIEKAKEVAGVTRVFVQPITPAVGQVTVYFMRDNDLNPIPDASEVTTVKNSLLEILPANTDPVDLIVAAPTGVSTDFTFTAITPDTSTMHDAVEANLQQFFAENTEVGVNIDEDAYRSAIFNTIDLATGERVQSFTLSAPAGDITISTGEIGTLGTVSFL